jgi:hypothetical protein
MYNGAGKFTKTHGLPSKSGVSGALMTVIPGLGAIGSFSPLINEEGNSIRSIGMLEQLSKIYLNFNLFFKDPIKRDLTRRAHQTIVWTVIAGINAAASGDIETL